MQDSVETLILKWFGYTA